MLRVNEPDAYIGTQKHYMERRSQVEELASGAGLVVVCVEWRSDIERSTRWRTSGERATPIKRQARKRLRECWWSCSSRSCM